MTNQRFADAFDNQVTNVQQSNADIAGHYPFSPERWRLYVDGTRQFVQYDTVTQYNDIVDGHELTPAQGETVTLTTTERYKYVVGYVLEPSFAYQISRSLETGDKAVIGYGDPDLSNDMASADGWFWIHTPDIGDNEVTVAEYRAGTEVDSQTVSLKKSLDIWKRLAIRLNWYNVGEARYIETYTETGDQINAEQGKTSVDDAKGAETGNHPITASVTRGAGSSAITFEVGSAALQTLGGGAKIAREKTHSFEAATTTADTWQAIHAMRVAPDREIVNTQLKNTDVVAYSGSGDVIVMPVAVDPSKTDASTWSTPESHNSTNSVIEVAGSVSTFPDSTGTSGSSASDPGGYQIGYGSWYASGGGSKTTVSSGGKTRKRQVSDRDVCVFVAKSTDTGTIQCEAITEQTW